jgi:hypothetical protein
MRLSRPFSILDRLMKSRARRNQVRGMQALACLLAVATSAVHVRAQQPPFVPPEPVREIAEIQALASDFTFVRIAYSRETDEPSAGVEAWATDAPEAEFHFSRQVEERLGLTARESRVLTLTDPELAQYPMIYLVEGGQLRLSDEEWAALASELRRVFPDRPIIDLPADHEVFSAYYAIKSRPAVPGLRELGRDSAEPHYRGIPAEDGRLMAILLHNMDFGDAWEFVDTPELYPVESSLGGAVPIGINMLVYALMN